MRSPSPVAALARTVAVAIVASVVLAGCATATPSTPPSASVSPPPVSASPAPPSTAAPSTAAPPSATASPLVPVLTSPPLPATADGWRSVPEQESVHGVQFQHVVWTGTRFVAVADANDNGGAFLDSVDGITWHRQTMSAPDAHPVLVAVGPGGLVAIGAIGNRDASWSSPDGLTWSGGATTLPVHALGTDYVQVTGLVATDNGWLAVGRRDPNCMIDCGTDPIRAMVWTSSDGLHWKQLASQASLGNASMTGVARLGSGFVAVGHAKDRAVVWTSPDGSTWTRVPDAPTFHPRPGLDSGASILVTAVAVGHDAVVVLGMDAPGGDDMSVRAWWSADGRTWAKATGARFAHGQVFSVVATPDGFLATGPSGEDSCRGGIWESADGRAWRCIAADPAFDGFGPYAAASNGSIEVAVGLGPLADEESPDGSPGAAWWRAVP